MTTDKTYVIILKYDYIEDLYKSRKYKKVLRRKENYTYANW